MLGAGSAPSLDLSGEGLVEVLVDFLQHALGCVPALIRPDQQREIFGHVAGLDRFYHHAFQRFGEFQEFCIIIQLGAVL